MLQIIPTLNSGGAERSTLEITQALAAAGARALVATASGRLVPAVEAAGGRVLTLPLTSKNPLTIIANGFALARAVRREGITVLHARSRAPAWSALIAATLAGVPLVTTFHGLYRAKGPLKRWYNGVMAKGVRVIANSEFTARHIKATYPRAERRIVTIPRGVDLSTFDPAKISPERKMALRQSWGVSPQARLLLVPGRLTAWKGQDLVIEAFAALVRQGQADDVVALLLGDTQSESYRRRLEARVETLGLGDKVRLAGHCADMQAAYADAALVAQASRAPEAFGRVAAEAQAMGAVVVASDLGAAPETVLTGAVATGFLVPPDDVPALAEAFARALALTLAERRLLADRAMAHIRARFSLARMGADTLAVYDAVTETPHAR